MCWFEGVVLELQKFQMKIVYRIVKKKLAGENFGE